MHGQARRTKESGTCCRCARSRSARASTASSKQFRGYFAEASRRSGKTGENLLQLLESRLDNVVFRAGFAPSRDALASS